LQLKPDYAEALSNRGTTLVYLKRTEEALASYEHALQLKPDYAEALNNRGNALVTLKRIEEALASFERALQLKPRYAHALANLGSALGNLGRHEAAATVLARLLEIAPDHEYGLGQMFHARLRCCAWTHYGQDGSRIVQAVQEGRKADVPLNFLAVSDSAELQLRCSRTYVSDRYPPAPAPLRAGRRYRHDRIRVAYVSADFRDHAVSCLTAGLFEAHDRDRFETLALSLQPEDDSPLGRRVRAAFERFVDVSRMSDREVAALLRELEVDIAVDLTGFTTDARTGIFAHRGAPVQVNYLGFPATMGAEYIDYIIADRFVIPEGKRAHYSEQVVYLPDTFQANDDKRRIAERMPTRHEAGLPESGLVFCSFNNSYKINPRFFDVWMRLLQSVAGSVLWLVADNASVRDNLRAEAAKRHVDPDRLVFAPRIDYADHLARLRLADLFLDSLPFNAGTSASDALWAGVPVLTCAGEAFAARMAGSLLHAIGLPGMITFRMEDYEALALRLTTSPDVLAGVRATLARNRANCALFDTDRFRQHIEAAYLAMWERHQRCEAPASFSVPPRRPFSTNP
jgi:predicted O-linked N-acetylglucosamine transferase (SPINDLY family)